MSFKVAIIGAGWYGCHIGWSLANIGFEVAIFESERRTLHRASGNNQFRLHMGFHYARHHRTRQQSRDGYQKFIERYPLLSSPVEENLYVVPLFDSLIDFATYKAIMASSGIDFAEVLDRDNRFQNIDGVIKTRERVLLIKNSREYFEENLKDILYLNSKVYHVRSHERYVEVEGVRFDYVIDASWGHFLPIHQSIYYEPTILLYYEIADGRTFPAVTFVDGPLCSIYPTEDPSIFTLSSVAHTPLGQFSTPDEARDTLNKVDERLIETKRNAMEEQISRYLPQFRENFNFSGIQLAIKTKPVGREDNRSCSIYRNGRVFSVMSGKIDTIFYATERILSLIEAENSKPHVGSAMPFAKILSGGDLRGE